MITITMKFDNGNGYGDNLYKESFNTAFDALAHLNGYLGAYPTNIHTFTVEGLGAA
jgi:hypothetical protein